MMINFLCLWLSHGFSLQGASGNREGNHGFPDQLPSWSAGHSTDFGFALLRASKTSLDFTFYSAGETAPTAVDHFVINK